MIDKTLSLTERMCFSIMKRYTPEVASYGYRTSLGLDGVERASRIMDHPEFLTFVEDRLALALQEDGTLPAFHYDEFSMDMIRPGNIFLSLYTRTGKEKYRKIADTFFDMLMHQPRTASGGFWHKKCYPNQMWLDGLYMQGPFYAQYTKMFGGLDKALEDIVAQMELVYAKTKKPNGLLVHAWDESRASEWCNKETGCSTYVWSRALGWFVMTIADLLEIIPKEEKYQDYRERLLRLGLALAPAVLAVQDKDSGLWWQILDMPNVGKNYLETSGTLMYVYFFAKMHRMGFLPEEYRKAAEKGFYGLVDKYVTYEDDGEMHLGGICKGAGLGKFKPDMAYRDGTFEYYTEKEPMVVDNMHGCGPFVMAGLEIEFGGKL